MTTNRNVIAASAVLVVFFLLFLGMHVPFLHQSPNPKPRTKAVLNLFAKSASSPTSATKLDHAPPPDFLHESHPDQIPLSYVVDIHRSPVAESAASSDMRLPKGRSPPRC